MSATVFHHRRRVLAIVLIVCILLISVGISFSQKQQKTKTTADKQMVKSSDRTTAPLVTFVELGSVRCIPCKKMQPVMKAIEKKYGTQVKVVFHDVWTDEGKPQADVYKIKLIPTQVFLDATGKEFFRHEGFYPESEIDILLKARGVKIQAGS